MKVIFFIGSLGGGGAERVVCDLSNHLTNKKHDVEILTMTDANAGYELNQSVNKTCLLVTGERRNRIIDNIVRIRRLISHMKDNNDCCYIVMLPVTTILLLIFRKFTKSKVIVAERADPANYSIIVKKLLRCFAKNADIWVFQTEEIKQWYDKYISKGIVIPNAINSTFLRPKYTGEMLKRIVGAGRLTDIKNFGLLIEAFSKITNDFPDYNLVIYGEGPNRVKLENQIYKLGIENKVSLPGRIDNLGEELEKSTLFVLSSVSEGMPNALMEAMALGLPCITTDCGSGARYLIQHKENGLVVPSSDISELKDAMHFMLYNSREVKDYGSNAKKIQEKLRPNIIYDEWEKAIMAR